MIRTCALLLHALLLSPLIAQTTFTVPTATHPTVQSAVGAAVSGDTILVAAGTYVENVDLLGKSLLLKGSGAATCVIDGGNLGPVFRQAGATVETRIEGFTVRNGFASHGGGLRADGSEIRLVRCEFSANRAGFGGGAVWFGGSPPARLTVDDCDFVGNEASYDGGALSVASTDLIIGGSHFSLNKSYRKGGAVWWEGATATITDSDFNANEAGRSGGAVHSQGCDFTLLDSQAVGNVVSGGNFDYLAAGGAFAVLAQTATFKRCRVLGNSATQAGSTFSAAEGGGILAYAASVTVEDCEIRGNFVSAGAFNGHAQSYGGGISCSSGSSPGKVRRCIIAENHARAAATTSGSCEGGGLRQRAAFTQTEGCIIYGNSATYQGPLPVSSGGFGGGVFAGLGLVRGCTILHNSASHGGGGISGAQVVANSIIRGNAPSQLQPSTTVEFNNIEGGWPGTGNVDVVPQFVDAANGDYHLAVGSPCIDAGGIVPAAQAAGFEFDIDGQPRPLDAGPDMGADEVPGSPFLDPACAAGTVGIGDPAGPFDTLLISGSRGGGARHIVIPLTQSFTIDVVQPPTTTSPASFYVAGYVGVPGPAQATPLPLGIGTLCIPLPFPAPGAPGSFVLTSSFGPDPNQLVPSTPTPWSYPVPALFFPFVMTLQGIVQETPTILRTTNAILVEIR